MMRIASLTWVAICAIATPGLAQSMPGMDMKGMEIRPQKPKPAARKAQSKAAPRHKAPVPAGDMRGMDMSPPARAPASAPDHAGMPGMDHGGMAGMDMSGPAAMSGPAGTDLPAGHDPAPPLPADHYADRFFPAEDMGRSREAMMREDGGQTIHQILFNLAEIQILNSHAGYRWDSEGFIGGDINRLWIKSEGEGTFRDGVDSAEVQALFSHAIGPYYNLQAGVRQDIRPTPSQTYATVGFEGLSPYEFETEGALFLSTKGDLLARLEAWYDQRITQRLVVQPRVELNLSAQDVPQDRYGAGIVDAELGLRLRYEIKREFAPYIGVSWERKTGRSAECARADGERPDQTGFVIGVRTWF
ncbi:copper resistance protein B [Sphingomonas oryzagri]|uniref:Copper resistance protein B n=1 Tax=Sphingomonas oryzagri TaxID=3042314 RepID=A0ABT6N0K9_9SPHN|nr:copper resistance protein B [Sphingomonas oryzagri]MDH7638284.1 copper resistance protein B [Sphingomonas oryzagri]